GAGARFRIEHLGAEIFPPRVSRMAILSVRVTRSAAASSDFDRLSAGGRWIRSLGSFGLSKHTRVSAIFGEGTKRVLSQVLSQKEGTRNPGWCGVLRVKRARSEEGVPFAPPHGTSYLRNTSCRMAHPP